MIRWFDELANDDVSLVGGKNASLGEMCRQLTPRGKRNHRHSGICGQAPSDSPEFAAFLVREGIDSISHNPDSVMKITLRVLEMERVLAPAGSAPECVAPEG